LNSFHLSLPILGIISTGIIFVFTYMYTHFLYKFHSPTPCSVISPPNWCQPSPLGRTCSDFVEKRERIRRKKWHFSLFEIKVATQGVSLWYFHVYIL
jgi:hypothetical protein